MKLIELHIDQIIALCKKYMVKKLYVFGSILTDKFNEDSDIDFAIDFDHEKITKSNQDWATLFFDFMHELERLLGKKIDLVFDSHISNKIFRKELDSTKKLIYG